MRRGRGLLWGMCALAGALLGCETTRNPGGVQRDVVPPTIQLKTASDTQDIAGGLNFSVVATDNLGLKDIRLTYTGGFISQTDTVFTSAVTTLTLQEKITPGSGAGGLIRIVGRATDGSANFAEDTLFIFLQNIDALRVYLVQPATGAVAGQGKYVPIQVAAHQKAGVKRVGWLVGGPAGQTARTADSIANGAPPFPDTLNFIDSVLVTGNGTPPNTFFTVVGFAVDSGNRVAQTSPITVTIQSVATDNTAPQIEQTIALRRRVVGRHRLDRHGARDRPERHYRHRIPGLQSGGNADQPGFDRARRDVDRRRQEVPARPHDPHADPAAGRGPGVRLRRGDRAQLRRRRPGVHRAEPHRRGARRHGHDRGRRDDRAAVRRQDRGRDLQRQPARAVPHEPGPRARGDLPGGELDVRGGGHPDRGRAAVGRGAVAARYAGCVRRLDRRRQLRRHAVGDP